MENKTCTTIGEEVYTYILVTK